MKADGISGSLAALRRIGASAEPHWRALTALLGPSSARVSSAVIAWLRLPHPRLRKLGYWAGGLCLLLGLGLGALWWRLSSGPINIDIVTPWLTSAIEENFGSGHKVEIGGTQIERDEAGHTSVRIRDIVVRDSDGTVVASAPKAEIALSGSSLLTGHMRAERLSLVGAQMSVRIEADGNVTVFAGADKRPIASASATGETLPGAAKPVEAGVATPAPEVSAASASRAGTGFGNVGALLAWIDGLSATGLDGYELRELGLKSGSLVVDDQRSGKHWVFDHIDVSLTHPHSGGVIFKVSSDNRTRPWLLTASMTPGTAGRRLIRIDATKVSTKDIMLAMRVDESSIEADLPISATLRAEIGPDGTPRSIEGKIVADAGEISDPHSARARMKLDRAEFNIDWDAARRSLTVPFQILSGGNRLTLLAQVDVPTEFDPSWKVLLTGGSVVLADGDDPPLVLNRILVALRCNLEKRLITIDQANAGNLDLGVAARGTLDFAGGDPRLAVGMAGNRMNVSALKRLWPVFIQPDLRAWVEEHIVKGAIEQIAIATNAPISTMIPGGPPVPDEGMSIDIVARGAVLRPVDTLPAIDDADLSIHTTGRTATVNLGRGTINLPSGRKMTISNGVFEIPDNVPRPIPSRTRFRLDGLVPAAAELLASDRLRDFSGSPVDPAASRGTFSAQVTVAIPIADEVPPGSSDYSITVDLSNFAADHMIMGQKIEATALKILANTQGYQVKGDVKISGTPASIDYRKGRGDADAEIRLQTHLDDAARARLGFDLGTMLAGSVPIKAAGHLGANGENKFTIEADLSGAKIENLLPGWQKGAGTPAKATFSLLTKPQATTRIDDLSIEGPGMSVKGSIELDSSGDLVAANFPVFGMSANDRATLKAERGTDGTLRVTMRGDLFDGRGFIKMAMGGPGGSKPAKPPGDLDLDIRLSVVTGFHVEPLRGLELRLARRAGEIRSLSLNGKLGRDAPLVGDLRARGGGGARQVIVIQSDDAGALFRFTDVYPRMFGGQMAVMLDAPTAEQGPQDGVLDVRNFVIRGEASLDRFASNAQGGPNKGVEFARMEVHFTRTPGRLTIHDGVVKGPVIGTTFNGTLDYARDLVHMSGTFVPIYGLNNMINGMLGPVPIIGDLIGGRNGGILGMTYEVVGPPSRPEWRVNPFSPLAPGILKKVFEFPVNDTAPASTGSSSSFAGPSR